MVFKVNVTLSFESYISIIKVVLMMWLFGKTFISYTTNRKKDTSNEVLLLLFRFDHA